VPLFLHVAGNVRPDTAQSVDALIPARYTCRLCSAVIKTGGKQYRVSQGDRLRVESLDAGEGDAVNLDQVMMVGEGDNVTVGTPTVAGASVSAKVLTHGRGKKVDIVKFRRRKHYRRQMGHRQNYTEVEITGIQS